MSEDKTQQPVVNDADTQAKPGSEAEGARTQGDDLDALLAVFDDQVKAPPPPPQQAAPAQQTESVLLDRLKAVEGVVSNFEQAKFKTEMNETVKEIRGDMDPDVFDNDLVEAWLDSRARKDNRLQTAWLQKDTNPRQWSRIRSELGREFKKRFDKMPDRNVTEDREAVAAAVRGASNRAPPDTPVNLGRLSNAEYRNKIREDYGFDPGI